MKKLFPFTFMIIDFVHYALDAFLDFLKEWSATIVFAIVVLFCLYVGYLVFYPYDPIRIDYLVIDKTIARVGDEVCFRLIGEKFMDVPDSVTVDLVNGEGILIMDYITNTPPGTHFSKRCFNVPMHVKTNDYQLRWRGTYRINALRDAPKAVFSKPIHIENDIEREGPRGKQGKQGKQGSPGPRGFTGAKGFTGPKGGIVIFGK